MTGAHVAAVVASYLLGAIPTSYLVGRFFRGIDLREHGSRNLGATNVYRVLGWRYAVPVAAFDIAKGAIPVLVFAPLASESAVFRVVCGLTAVIGHVYSVFVRFRGGKGVATAAGVMLGLTPAALGLAAVVWLLVLRLSGYVSLASMTGALVLPAAVYVLHPDARWLAAVDLALAVAIIWFHRANIRRLLQGTENRFGRRAASGGQRA